MKPAIYTFLLSFVFLADGFPLGVNSGPYEIDIKKLDWCGDYDIKLFDTAEFTRLNKTAYKYSTNIYMPYGFNDETEVDAEVAIFNLGAWNTVFRKSADKLCSMGKSYAPSEMTIALKAIGVDDCPVPAGNYSVKDVVMNMEFKVKELPYNKYRIDSHFKHKGKRFACCRLFVDINPKKDR